MKKLHRRFGDRVRFVEVHVRQAHPGPGVRPFHDLDAKRRTARRYRDEEGLPWDVLVDDLEGTVHRTYGGLADPTYLIDRNGRVAFHDAWTHAPTLYLAVRALRDRGGEGVVEGGARRAPHLLPPMADGWRAIRRGLWQSLVDLETSLPGSGLLLFAGHRVRPLLAPLALRAKPLPRVVRWGLATGLTVAFPARTAAGRTVRALLPLAARARRQPSRPAWA